MPNSPSTAPMEPVPPGQMYLYDQITPPLLDGTYRLTVTTEVTRDSIPQKLPGDTRYFTVGGYRFSLPATEVAGVFPPRNAQGSFQESVPHIVIRRRTLPWERELDPTHRLSAPARSSDDPPPPNPLSPADGYGTPPWLALLLFEEGEYKLLSGLPLEKIVPSDVFARLGKPAPVVCDAIEAATALVASLLPSLEELTLLAHVRQVSIEDRELSVEGSDGWFSVVMSNRLPSPGAKCRACLVSLEERTELVRSNPPAVADPTEMAAILHGTLFTAEQGGPPTSALNPFASTRLVLLHSWQFESANYGTFKDLMQRLDVGIIGKVATSGTPALTDTGHAELQIRNRVGEEQTAWYRSPLVPFPLTRDPNGPYHSADQCRRATPDTGMEDVSYAAAFEVGRLLAAADGRLAVELMHWRRTAFKQAARVDTFSAVSMRLPTVLPLDPHQPVPPILAVSAAARLAGGAGPLADPYGLTAIGAVGGLEPGALKEAWGLDSIEQAQALLGADAGALGAVVAAPTNTPRVATTIDEVAADAEALTRLRAARDRVVTNATVRMEQGK